jgi:hypothetical protein
MKLSRLLMLKLSVLHDETNTILRYSMAPKVWCFPNQQGQDREAHAKISTVLVLCARKLRLCSSWADIHIRLRVICNLNRIV